MSSWVRRLFGRGKKYDFKEDVEYYHEYVRRSFRVIEVDRDANNLIIVFDYMPNVEVTQPLSMYERKANKGIIYPLTDNNDKGSHDNI